jgi:hypothetical protein
MPDDLSNRARPDRSRINVNEPWEVRFWCERFGVTPAELKKAVEEVGVLAADVRRHLGK